MCGFFAQYFSSLTYKCHYDIRAYRNCSSRCQNKDLIAVFQVPFATEFAFIIDRESQFHSVKIWIKIAVFSSIKLEKMKYFESTIRWFIEFIKCRKTSIWFSICASNLFMVFNQISKIYRMQWNVLKIIWWSDFINVLFTIVFIILIVRIIDALFAIFLASAQNILFLLKEKKRIHKIENVVDIFCFVFFFSIWKQKCNTMKPFTNDKSSWPMYFDRRLNVIAFPTMCMFK